MKKVRKDLWEKLFVYPSFNIRFWFTLLLVLFIFCVIAILYFRSSVVNNISDQISSLNLFVQTATLVLGIFAAYYALRQLVETRFTNLDEAGMQELKRTHYSRAFEKWKEAFYIRPEASVFTNMNEALLLLGDYDTFDHYMQMSKHKGFLKKPIFEETSDKIIFLYLKTIRNLLVKNQGEAEKYLTNLISFVKQNGVNGVNWDFLDLQTSVIYQDLQGECKNIAENLISYLSKKMQPVRLADFEAGNFATQINEPSEESQESKSS